MEELAKIETVEEKTLECVPKKGDSKPAEDNGDSKSDEVPFVVDTICPHCGLDTEVQKFEVSEDDRDQWMRHILSGGGQRFTKDYTIYGGRIAFKLKSRTGIEDRDIDLATAEFVHSINSISDFQKIRVEMMKIQLLYSLDYITYIDPDNPENTKRVPITAPTRNEIEEAWKLQKSAAISKYLAFLEDTPTSIMALISDKLVSFNAVVSMLTLEGLNPDF